MLVHMTFTNGLKKRTKIVQSSFYFCQLMIMKDGSPSYQKHAWNYIYRWFDEATWSFSLYFKQILGEEHFLFLSKLFWNNFQSSLDLERKRNPAILSSGKKALEIRENKAAIVPDINDHLTAGYDRKVYIGNVLEIDNSSAKVSFHEHAGTLSISSIFHEPKKLKVENEIWVDFVNVLAVNVLNGSSETNREKKIEHFVLENVMGKFYAWKNKNWRFFLVLYCTRY